MQESHYTISTPENIDLHLELAGLGNRIYACFVDTIITYALLLFLMIVTLFAIVATAISPISSSVKTFATFTEFGIAIFIAMLVVFGYYIYFEGIWQGQTPGKRLVGIRVIEQNGQPVGWSSIIIRNLLRTIDIAFSLVGLLVMFIDPAQRRLGDLTAGTLVIRERQLDRSSVHPEFKSDPQKLSVIDIGRITPREYDVLLSYMSRRKSLAQSQQPLVAHRLEHYFRTRLNQPVDGQSADSFLETVCAAYQAR